MTTAEEWSTARTSWGLSVSAELRGDPADLRVDPRHRRLRWTPCIGTNESAGVDVTWMSSSRGVERSQTITLVGLADLAHSGERIIEVRAPGTSAYFAGWGLIKYEDTVLSVWVRDARGAGALAFTEGGIPDDGFLGTLLAKLVDETLDLGPGASRSPLALTDAVFPPPPWILAAAGRRANPGSPWAEAAAGKRAKPTPTPSGWTARVEKAIERNLGTSFGEDPTPFDWKRFAAAESIHETLNTAPALRGADQAPPTLDWGVSVHHLGPDRVVPLAGTGGPVEDKERRRGGRIRDEALRSLEEDGFGTGIHSPRSLWGGVAMRPEMDASDAEAHFLAEQAPGHRFEPGPHHNLTVEGRQPLRDPRLTDPTADTVVARDPVRRLIQAAGLTDRERTILGGKVIGLTNEQIAAAVELTVRGAEAAWSRIKEKCQAAWDHVPQEPASDVRPVTGPGIRPRERLDDQTMTLEEYRDLDPDGVEELLAREFGRQHP